MDAVGDKAVPHSTMPPTNKIKVTGATPEEERELHKLFPHLFDAPPTPKPDPRLTASIDSTVTEGGVTLKPRNSDPSTVVLHATFRYMKAPQLLETATACIDAAAALAGISDIDLVTLGTTYPEDRVYYAKRNVKLVQEELAK